MEEVLEIVARVVALALAIYATASFKKRGLGLLLAASFLLIASYNVMPLGGEQWFGTWVSHAPVYIGLLLLFIFINSFAKSDWREPGAPGAAYIVAPVAAIVSSAAALHWLQLMTNEGLQHLLTLPLFGALLISSLLRSAQSEAGTIQRPLRWFIAGGFFLTVIHVMEFFVESQGLVPALDGEPVEILEMVWLYLAAACFFMGIKSGRKLKYG